MGGGGGKKWHIRLGRGIWGNVGRGGSCGYLRFEEGVKRGRKTEMANFLG